jgi:hypothetical protein
MGIQSAVEQICLPETRNVTSAAGRFAPPARLRRTIGQIPEQFFEDTRDFKFALKSFQILIL